MDFYGLEMLDDLQVEIVDSLPIYDCKERSQYINNILFDKSQNAFAFGTKYGFRCLGTGSTGRPGDFGGTGRTGETGGIGCGLSGGTGGTGIGSPDQLPKLDTVETIDPNGPRTITIYHTYRTTDIIVHLFDGYGRNIEIEASWIQSLTNQEVTIKFPLDVLKDHDYTIYGSVELLINFLRRSFSNIKYDDISYLDTTSLGRYYIHHNLYDKANTIKINKLIGIDGRDLTDSILSKDLLSCSEFNLILNANDYPNNSYPYGYVLLQIIEPYSSPDYYYPIVNPITLYRTGFDWHVTHGWGTLPYIKDPTNFGVEVFNTTDKSILSLPDCTSYYYPIFNWAGRTPFNKYYYEMNQNYLGPYGADQWYADPFQFVGPPVVGSGDTTSGTIVFHSPQRLSYSNTRFRIYVEHIKPLQPVGKLSFAVSFTNTLNNSVNNVVINDLISQNPALYNNKKIEWSYYEKDDKYNLDKKIDTTSLLIQILDQTNDNNINNVGLPINNCTLFSIDFDWHTNSKTDPDKFIAQCPNYNIDNDITQFQAILFDICSPIISSSSPSSMKLNSSSSGYDQIYLDNQYDYSSITTETTYRKTSTNKGKAIGNILKRWSGGDVLTDVYDIIIEKPDTTSNNTPLKVIPKLSTGKRVSEPYVDSSNLDDGKWHDRNYNMEPEFYYTGAERWSFGCNVIRRVVGFLYNEDTSSCTTPLFMDYPYDDTTSTPSYDYQLTDKDNIDVMFWKCFGSFPVVDDTTGYVRLTYYGEVYPINRATGEIYKDGDPPVRVCDVLLDSTSVVTDTTCYIHYQTEAAHIWYVNHNKHNKNIKLEVYDDKGKLFVPYAVEIMNENQVAIVINSADSLYDSIKIDWEGTGSSGLGAGSAHPVYYPGYKMCEQPNCDSSSYCDSTSWDIASSNCPCPESSQVSPKSGKVVVRCLTPGERDEIIQSCNVKGCDSRYIRQYIHNVSKYRRSNVWHITHNLNTTNIGVNCYNDDNMRIGPDIVRILDENTIEIEFLYFSKCSAENYQFTYKNSINLDYINKYLKVKSPNYYIIKNLCSSFGLVYNYPQININYRKGPPADGWYFNYDCTRKWEFTGSTGIPGYWIATGGSGEIPIIKYDNDFYNGTPPVACFVIHNDHIIYYPDVDTPYVIEVEDIGGNSCSDSINEDELGQFDTTSNKVKLDITRFPPDLSYLKDYFIQEGYPVPDFMRVVQSTQYENAVQYTLESPGVGWEYIEGGSQGPDTPPGKGWELVNNPDHYGKSINIFLFENSQYTTGTTTGYYVCPVLNYLNGTILPMINDYFCDDDLVAIVKYSSCAAIKVSQLTSGSTITSSNIISSYTDGVYNLWGQISAAINTIKHFQNANPNAVYRYNIIVICAGKETNTTDDSANPFYSISSEYLSYLPSYIETYLKSFNINLHVLPLPILTGTTSSYLCDYEDLYELASINFGQLQSINTSNFINQNTLNDFIISFTSLLTHLVGGPCKIYQKTNEWYATTTRYIFTGGTGQNANNYPECWDYDYDSSSWLFTCDTSLLENNSLELASGVLITEGLDDYEPIYPNISSFDNFTSLSIPTSCVTSQSNIFTKNCSDTTNYISNDTTTIIDQKNYEELFYKVMGISEKDYYLSPFDYCEYYTGAKGLPQLPEGWESFHRYEHGRAIVTSYDIPATLKDFDEIIFKQENMFVYTWVVAHYWGNTKPGLKIYNENGVLYHNSLYSVTYRYDAIEIDWLDGIYHLGTAVLTKPQQNNFTRNANAYSGTGGTGPIGSITGGVGFTGPTGNTGGTGGSGYCGCTGGTSTTGKTGGSGQTGQTGGIGFPSETGGSGGFGGPGATGGTGYPAFSRFTGGTGGTGGTGSSGGTGISGYSGGTGGLGGPGNTGGSGGFDSYKTGGTGGSGSGKALKGGTGSSGGTGSIGSKDPNDCSYITSGDYDITLNKYLIQLYSDYTKEVCHVYDEINGIKTPSYWWSVSPSFFSYFYNQVGLPTEVAEYVQSLDGQSFIIPSGIDNFYKLKLTEWRSGQTYVATLDPDGDGIKYTISSDYKSLGIYHPRLKGFYLHKDYVIDNYDDPRGSGTLGYETRQAIWSWINNKINIKFAYSRDPNQLLSLYGTNNADMYLPWTYYDDYYYTTYYYLTKYWAGEKFDVKFTINIPTDSYIQCCYNALATLIMSDNGLTSLDSLFSD